MGRPTTLRVLLGAVGALIGVGLTAAAVISGTFGPAAALLVVIAGVLGIWQMAQGKFISALPRRGAGILTLGGAAAVAVIDGNWLSSLWVVVPGLLFALAWMSLSKQLAPAADLGGDVDAALKLAGVVMSDESLAGWRVGGSPSGVVVIVREAAVGSGPISQWSSIKKLVDEAKMPMGMMESQGITPLALAVVAQSGFGPESVEGVTVVSADRVAGLVKRAEPSIADPLALAREAGIELSRDQQRALARTSAPRSSGSPKKGGPKVVHQGRVTKSNKK